MTSLNCDSATYDRQLRQRKIIIKTNLLLLIAACTHIHAHVIPFRWLFSLRRAIYLRTISCWSDNSIELCTNDDNSSTTECNICFSFFKFEADRLLSGPWFVLRTCHVSANFHFDPFLYGLIFFCLFVRFFFVRNKKERNKQVKAISQNKNGTSERNIKFLGLLTNILFTNHAFICN